MENNELQFIESEGRFVNPTVTPEAIRAGLKEIAKNIAITGEPYTLNMALFDQCVSLEFINRTLTSAYMRVTMNRVPEMQAAGVVTTKYNAETREYTLGLRAEPRQRKDNGKAVAAGYMKGLQAAVNVKLDVAQVTGDLKAVKQAVELYRAEIQKLIEDVE